MIYYAEKDIIIRIIDDSDIQAIVKAEVENGEEAVPDKYLYTLKVLNESKNVMLIAKYKDEVAGYVNIRPLSSNGPFIGKGFSEILGLKVFDKYKNLGIEEKLIDVAERVGAEYSSTVFIGFELNSGEEALNKYVKRGYIPHKSGIWKKSEIYASCEDGNDLVLWLYKKKRINSIHKLLMMNTPEFPFLRWWKDRKKTIYTCVNIEKCQEIKEYDEVFLKAFKDNNFVSGIVSFKHEYDSYEELLETEGVKKILPFLEDDDVDKAIKFFKNFKGFEFVNDFGCVAIGIRVLDLKF